MKCYTCHRQIKPGLETRKHIEERITPDGLVLFGDAMPGGPVEKAAGPISRAWHSRCYHAAAKRVARGGDAVLGTTADLADFLYADPDAHKEQEDASEDQRGH
jgi:hypothetical protein